MKITIYIIYFVIFTLSYFFLNSKLTNKWIFIIYPLVFILPIYPLRLIFASIVKSHGLAFAEAFIILIMFAFAIFTLFNFFYGIVNVIVDTQVGFQQGYDKSNVGHIKSFTDNAANIKRFFHLFFYLGGVILFAIVVFKSKI